MRCSWPVCGLPQYVVLSVTTTCLQILGTQLIVIGTPISIASLMQ